MDLAALQPTPALTISNAKEPDSYVNRIPSLRTRWLPAVGDFEFRQASFWLDGIFLSMSRKWPSITDGVVTGEQTMVSLSMYEPAPAHFNGWEVNAPALAVGRQGAGYKTIEAAPWTVAIVIFPSHLLDRGWPETGTVQAAIRISQAAMNSVRAFLREAFRVASFAPERLESRQVVAGMAETAHGVFDDAFASSSPIYEASSGLVASYYRLARQVDEYILAHPQRPISSDDIAMELGVTSRTLHTVMRQFYGMSLHRYLRLQRLWSVRRILLAGEPGALVKSIALDHGFWHLGRFSGEYQKLFGESPSQTLANAQK